MSSGTPQKRIDDDQTLIRPGKADRDQTPQKHMWHEMRPYSRIIIRETGPLAPFYIVDPCDQIQDFYPDQYSQISK